MKGGSQRPTHQRTDITTGITAAAWPGARRPKGAITVPDIGAGDVSAFMAAS
jgi:hypothetical protein